LLYEEANPKRVHLAHAQSGLNDEDYTLKVASGSQLTNKPIVRPINGENLALRAMSVVTEHIGGQCICENKNLLPAPSADNSIT